MTDSNEMPTLNGFGMKAVEVLNDAASILDVMDDESDTEEARWRNSLIMDSYGNMIHAAGVWAQLSVAHEMQLQREKLESM